MAGILLSWVMELETRGDLRKLAFYLTNVDL